VLIMPVVEELIYRGAILASLLERTTTFWAIAVTVAAATIMHDSWRIALPDQILLCMAYLIRGRSVATSVIAHVVANALIFVPNLVILFHIK
jgi:membrane protease YdiL (CAAX protease family)